MREECITAVRKAAGEIKLSDADIAHIESHIREAWEQEGSKHAGFADLSLDQQINRVSVRAKESFFSDSSRLKPYELLASLEGDNQVTQLQHRIAHQATGGGSVEISIRGLKSHIYDKFQDYHKFGTKAFGFKNDTHANTELLLALRGETNVRPEAVKLAKVFHDAMDFLVKEAKEVGLKFHALENYTPQPMDFRKISAISKKDFIDRTLPRLDLSEYQKRGIQDSDSLRSFLGDVYETLASEGRNKVIASKGKVSSYGNSLGGRLRQPRQLHYTPQGLVDAMKDFGSELTVDGMMSRSFNNLIRDIAVSKNIGANAHENFNFVLAETYMRDKQKVYERHPDNINKRNKAIAALQAQERQTQRYWDQLTSGRQSPSIFDTLTDLELVRTVITKLGSQALYIPKEIVATASLASQQVGFSWKSSIAETWRASPVSSQERKAFIKSITVGVEHTATGLSHDLETNSRSVMGVMAKKVMDWQGLTALDNMVVRGLSATLQDYVGGFTRNFKDMGSLKKQIGEQSFKTIIEDHRFSERDLKILSLAETESFKGKGTYLTDKHIYNISHEKISSFLKTGENAERVLSDLADKYRTYIWSTIQEHARGSVGATMQDKRWITGKDGQVNNLLRLATQFLVMPVSWARMHLIDIPNNMVGGGLGLSANVYRAKALVIGILGEELIRNTLIPLISGKDPRFDFSDPWEYAKALLNGVLHYERFSPVGKQSGWDILGPALGQAGRLGVSAYDAYTEKNRRKKGKAQAGLMKEVLNSTVPFQNMWYTKYAFDHFVREKLDDAINPGGRKRAEAYRRKKIQRDKRK